MVGSKEMVSMVIGLECWYEGWCDDEDCDAWCQWDLWFTSLAEAGFDGWLCF
jgi:hypothetical protein